MIKDMEKQIAEVRAFWESISWEDPKAYGLWLSQAYYIARRSTSFLGLCLFHSHNYPEFQVRCTHHIAEETGHEKLILNDLKRLGQPLSPELPSTAAIYQTQYYRIVSENPLSFVGYIFWLELLAPAYGPYIMGRVPNKNALSFLKVHTSADEDHIAEATKIFETVPEEIKPMIWSNFEMTAASYRTMLTEISLLTQERQQAA